MTGVGQGESRKPFWARIKDYGEFLAMLWAGTLFMAGFLWAFAANEIRDGARSFLGINDLSASLSTLADVSAANIAAIEALRPPERVVEYDTLRSRVLSPCEIGTACRYQIRARRTAFGLSCGAPTVLQRAVTDRSGLQHFVEPFEGTPPRRIGGEWTSITLGFLTPDVTPGVAEFYLHLQYDCGGSVVEESTPRLVFEVTPHL